MGIMESGDLRYFEAVARLGVMTRAAAELHTVQSNVTARVRALEAALGTPLFERRSAGVVMTDAGRRLLPYAERIARLLDEAERVVQDNGIPRGPLVIGSLETTAAMRLAPLLTDYAGAFPQVDLAIHPGTTCELVAAVKKGVVDGAFVCGPVLDPELDQRPMFQEDLVVLASAHATSIEELIAKGNIRLAVLRAGCSYRLRLEQLLARRGVPAPRLMGFGTLETILACVSAGLGITLLPRNLLSHSRFSERLSILDLPADEARVETTFIRRRDAAISSALKAFLNFSLNTICADVEALGTDRSSQSPTSCRRQLPGCR
jgi:LysR family transcriptional regulator, cell division regulator